MPLPDHVATLGLLLAGGLSSRMGGGDKSQRLIGGQPLLAHVIARLGPQSDALLINANGDPARFVAYGLPVAADSVPGFAGPLAGILAGMDWVTQHRPDLHWLVSVAADTPFIPLDLVDRLHRARTEAGISIACAASRGRTHPIIALWPVALRDDLRQVLIVEDERKVSRWASRHGVAVAEWRADPVDPFFNANAPDDLTEAERLHALLPTINLPAIP